MRRLLRSFGVSLSLLGAMLPLVVGCGACQTTPPAGETGESADAIAREMQAAVNLEAWERTRALSWTFRGGREHLWDRDRGLARVTFDDKTVLFHIERKEGIVLVEGEAPVSGDAAREDVEKAYSAFINDAFWLNPTVTMFNQSASRELVEVDGEQAVLVTFGAGGVTPGDKYAFFKGADGRPKAYKMWVKVLPMPLRAEFEGWTALSTGAMVATRYPTSVPGGAVEIGQPQGAASLAELQGGEDPFAPLLETLEVGPASQPAGG